MTLHVGDSERSAHGQQVFTACAFIHKYEDDTHKLLLAKRSVSKKFLPGAWELIGGHVDFGEDFVSAVKREVYEELGIEVAVGDPFYVFDYANPVKGSHSVEVIYFARFHGPESNIVIDPNNHEDIGWFSRDEAEVAGKVNRSDNDPEYAAIHRGFDILNGQNYNLG